MGSIKQDEFPGYNFRMHGGADLGAGCRTFMTVSISHVDGYKEWVHEGYGFDAENDISGHILAKVHATRMIALAAA